MSRKKPAPAKVVFLFDVDNTLVDNDRVTADLKHYLEREVGPRRGQTYWKIFDQLRKELGYREDEIAEIKASGAITAPEKGARAEAA